MDFKGDINHQGDESKRLYLDKEHNIYMYPHQTARTEIFEFGSYNGELEVGDIISKASGKVPYDMGCNGFSAHTIGAEVQYPYEYRVRCHPIGYNYDTYMDGAEEGFHSYDYYVVDEILHSSSENDR